MNHTSKKRGIVKSEEEAKQEKEFSIRVNKALAGFFKIRHSWKECGKTLDELLDYSSKLLALVSEHPTVSNFREDLIKAKVDELVGQLLEMMALQKQKIIDDQNGEESLNEQEEEKDGEEAQPEPLLQLMKLFKDELTYLVGLSMRDPKCYQLWYHRKWIHSQVWDVEQKLRQDGSTTRKFLEGDMKICDKFLSKDERNFHAWNYRCYLVYSLLEKFPEDRIIIVEKELDFLKGKLAQNFSNYSAIHFQSKYLVLRERYRQGVESDCQVELPTSLLQQELSFVWDGIFIAPFEQSLWIYQDWLLTFYTVLSIVAVDQKTQDDQNKGISMQLNTPLSFDDVSLNEISPIFQIQAQIGEVNTDLEYKIEDQKILRINLGDLNVDSEGLIVNIKLNKNLKSRRLLFKDTDVLVGDNSWKQVSENERYDQVFGLLEASVSKVAELLQNEPDKKEVMLNYAVLKSQLLILSQGNLEAFQEEAESLKSQIFGLKERVESQSPLFDAIWSKIETSHQRLI